VAEPLPRPALDHTNCRTSNQPVSPLRTSGTSHPPQPEAPPPA
jgi:hypothetical protein